MFKYSTKQRKWKSALAGLMTLTLLLANLYVVPVFAETSGGDSDSAAVSGETADTNDENGTGPATVSGNDGSQTTPEDNDAGVKDPIPAETEAPAEGDAATVNPDAGISLLADEGDSMDIAGMADFAKGDKTAGTAIEDSTGKFSLICHGNSVVETKSNTFADGTTTAKRISLGGSAKTTAASIKFTTTGVADVVVYWTCGGDGRQMTILNSEGNAVATSAEDSTTKNSNYISTFTLEEAGTYYLGSNNSSNYVCGLKVVEENSVPESVEYSMDIAGMADFAKGDKTAGTAIEDSTGKFSLICHGNSVVEAKSNTFADGTTTAKRISLGGSAKTTAASIKFTTTGAADVVVYWTCGGDGRQMTILNSEGNAVATSAEDSTTKNSNYISTFTLEEAGTYYLGSNNSSNYVCGLKVKEEGQAQTVSVTPTITGLAEGQNVFLVKGGKEVAISSGISVKLETGKYNLIVKKNGAVDADYRASVNGADSVNIKDDTTAIEITVGSAYVNPVVKLADGSTLAADNVITLTKKGETSGTALEVGKTVKLAIGETYSLSTAEGSKTKATVDGKEEFTVADGMTELVITVEATVVNAKVTIFDPDSVKNQVKSLKLSDSNGVVADLLEKEGSTVELTIGTTYTLAMESDAEDLTFEINGDSSVKADKNTTELKVLLGKVTEGLYVIDLSNGLKKDVDYGGGLFVMEDMKYSGGAVQGSNNPLAGGVGAKGDVPDEGAVLILKAQQDGRLKIKLMSAGGKSIYFVDDADGQLDSFASNEVRTIVYKVEEGHTYYFYGNGTKIKMAAITVDYRPAVDWSTVSNPTLQTPIAAVPGDADEGTVSVPYTAQIGGIYADSLDIRIYQNGELLDSVNITDETDITEGYAGIAELTPTASGDYTFRAALKRSGEKEKLSNEVTLKGFILPMADPVIVNVESQGSGNVKFSWQAVPEATSYNVYLNGELKGSTSNLYYRLSGLAAGTEYTFAVEAVGNGDVSNRVSQKATVSGEAKKNWLFSAFGQGASSKESENGYSGSYETGDLKVWSVNNKGKLVPNSTDGLSFYYTTIDPETENFTLEADVTVDSWTYTNGQEGFGLMAADNVGAHGDSAVFWNNSYMASITKVEYNWDSEFKTVSDAGTKYTMRLGVGAQEKAGVTPENMASMMDGSGIADFRTNMYTLESSAAQTKISDDPEEYLPSGSYNLVGNYLNEKLDYPATMAGMSTTFHLTLQRNNTGYFLSYTDQNGVTTTKKFYHGDDGDELTKLDPNNIYVGFFASRAATVTFKNAKLTTIAPEKDAPAEERPIQYITPQAGFESAKIANKANYELVYYGNADGTLYLTNGRDVVADYVPVKANTKYRFNVTLRPGSNTVSGIFVPDPNYVPSKYERLSSYDLIPVSITVEYRESQRNIYYVSPEGGYWGDGDKDNPMDLYTAVSRVKPGDMIILMEGTYNYYQTVTIDRGMDGTAAANIYMIADPEAKTRPVLDFNNMCPGMVMAGDYWYFQGFDVTRSSASDKGIQVSGSHNTLDNLMAYRNGNTGIQISRYKSSDLWEDWPSDNLILNCTSYLNADPGYEDADGFAAKLTIADGNVFDGCIAAYNADDGWDLFAKIESGTIGKVVIRNCVAFKNGYDLSADGTEIVAGNGNGFKMGGSSMSGYHELHNSVAFANRAKGIDSNSCPDIQVYNSISFNNESYNVAFYTNDAKNTDFFATGVISYKDENGTADADNFKMKGTQDESKVRGETNFYFAGGKSVNTKKVQVESSWFEHLVTDAAIGSGTARSAILPVSRNADGTINMHGYLTLSAAAPAEVQAMKPGIQPAGTANGSTPSKVITIPELIDNEADDDDDEAGGSDTGKSETQITSSGQTIASGQNGKKSSPSTGDTSDGPFITLIPEKKAETDTSNKEVAAAPATPAEVPQGTENSGSNAGAVITEIGAAQSGSNVLPIVLGIMAVLVIGGGAIFFVMRRRLEEE